MKKIFNWLNGKKTAIGFILTWAAQLPGIDPAVSQILLYAGGALGSVGIMHKGIKSVNTTTPPQP